MPRRGQLQQTDPRFKVATARRILARGGCESGTAGHVSIRASDGESFWTSPFEYFDETTPLSVVRAGLDLELIEGTHIPSPAIEFHSAIYRAREDVNSVVHIHSHWASVLAATGAPIGMYNVGSVVFHNEQAFHVDDGTHPPVEGYRVVEHLGERSVLMIQNHGAIIVGATVERTTVLALMLEAAARYHYEAVTLGASEIPEAEVVRGKASYQVNVIPHMWDANYRRLRTSDPELFDWLAD